MQKENDTLLVAKLREGNKFAFEALYEKYSARLYNTIVLLVYDKSLAKDITQSSFMTIWEKRSNLDTEKSFPAYLCTIARNMVYKETERRLLHNKFVENKLKTEAEAIEEDTMDMDVSIIEKQIEQLLQSLPEVSREVFQLKRDRKTVQQGNRLTARFDGTCRRGSFLPYYETTERRITQIHHAFPLLLLSK